MFENFWKDRQENTGKNTYWTFFKGKTLNAEETRIQNFMQEMEERYIDICLIPRSKMDIAILKNVMSKASPDILEGLMRCCLLTNNFIPIKSILVGDWKNDFSYEQRFAMWRGANFKGAYAFAPDFIKEALNQGTPVTSNLWQKHLQIQKKMIPVEQIYADTIKETYKIPQKVSLWNSEDLNAQAFRNEVFSSSNKLKDLFENSVHQITSHNSLQKHSILKNHTRDY